MVWEGVGALTGASASGVAAAPLGVVVRLGCAAPAGVSTVSVLTGVNRVPHGDVVDKSVMGCYSYKSDNGQAAP